MRLKLRTKFVIPIIFLFLVGMGLSSYITFSSVINKLESNIYNQVEQTAEFISTNLSEWVTRNKLDVKRWARQDIFIDAIPESFLGKAARKAAFPVMKRIQDEYEFYEAIYLCDFNGKVLVSSSPDKTGNLIVGKDFFQKARTDCLSVSRIMPSTDSGAPVFIISAPLRADNEVVGVLLGIVNLGYFIKTSVDNVRFGKNGYVYILDEKQRIIAHPDHSRLFTSGNDLGLMDMGQPFKGYKPQRQDVINVVKKNSALNLLIGITAPVEEIFAPAKKIGQRVILVTIAVSIIVVTMVTLFVTRLVTTPIHTFVQSMKTVAEGNLDKKIQLDSTDEFSKMALSFNEMAKALKESKAELEKTYGQLVQKERMAALGELTARIAHEIKNPLGIIKGSAQIFIDKAESSEIKMEVAHFIIEEVNHLSLRVQELLGHVRPMALNLKMVNLNTILEERIQFWESQQEEQKKIIIVKDLSRDLPVLNLDIRLIRQLVMNMIINACEAMPEGGTLRITTKMTEKRMPKETNSIIESNCVILIFEDTGCGIAREDIQHIFDPFFTTKEGGTGLGLSAVYRILEKHDAKIQVANKTGKGTSFNIIFPLTGQINETNGSGVNLA